MEAAFAVTSTRAVPETPSALARSVVTPGLTPRPRPAASNAAYRYRGRENDDATVNVAPPWPLYSHADRCDVPERQAQRGREQSHAGVQAANRQLVAGERIGGAGEDAHDPGLSTVTVPLGCDFPPWSYRSRTT